MKITFIGTGYVGLVSGVLFADLGNDVICVDTNKDKIVNLKKGVIPIFEPGLEEILKKNLKSKRITFTTDLSKAVMLSKIIFIAVGTPTAKDGVSADLKNVFKVTKQIATNVNNYKIIINKSTVPVGTGDEVEKIISKRVKKNNFDIVSNPEFLREGEAIRDFKYPDRIIIGSNNLKKTKPILERLYLPIINKGAKFLSVSRRSAELIKYASNAFLATKITFINEIANLCEVTNTNIEDIAIGIGSDQRIGSRFLRAGPAYGGSCFPKDTKAIVKTAKRYKVDLSIVKNVIKSNNNRKKLITNKIIKILGKTKNKKIGFLGVTFKANTDDMRDSQFLKIYPKLLKKGCTISYYEPTGRKKEISSKIKFVNSVKNIIENNDLTVIHSEWDEFKNINFDDYKIKKQIKIFDLRNLYQPKNITNKKIKYYSIGRPNYE